MGATIRLEILRQRAPPAGPGTLREIHVVVQEQLGSAERPSLRRSSMALVTAPHVAVSQLSDDTTQEVHMLGLLAVLELLGGQVGGCRPLPAQEGIIHGDVQKIPNDAFLPFDTSVTHWIIRLVLVGLVHTRHGLDVVEIHIWLARLLWSAYQART